MVWKGEKKKKGLWYRFGFGLMVCEGLGRMVSFTLILCTLNFVSRGMLFGIGVSYTKVLVLFSCFLSFPFSFSHPSLFLLLIS